MPAGSRRPRIAVKTAWQPSMIIHCCIFLSVDGNTDNGAERAQGPVCRGCKVARMSSRTCFEFLHRVYTRRQRCKISRSEGIMRPCPIIHQVTLKETGCAHGVLRVHIGLGGTSTAAQTARPHGPRHHKAYQCDVCNGRWAAARDNMVFDGYTETRRKAQTQDKLTFTSRYATSNTLRL